MAQPLTVAVAQPPCVSGERSVNAGAHAHAVRSAGARLVVFPELSLTGYELDAAAVSPADDVFDPIVDACAATGSIALVGAPVRSRRGEEHIAMVRVDASGIEVAYRKTWLGSAEAARFAPGDGPAVMLVDGWRIGAGICKDTGVDEHVRGIAALNVDLYVAGLVHAPDELAEQDARAVRIALQCRAYVAFASCAGATGGGYDHTAGHSAIWTPDGQPIAQAGSQPGEIATASLPWPAVDRVG